MNKVNNFLKSEFINGRKPFDWVYLGIGLALQIIAIIYGFCTGTPDNTLSIISGITGVVSVILCAQGKISFYVFGYIQLFTYVFGVAFIFIVTFDAGIVNESVVLSPVILVNVYPVSI